MHALNSVLAIDLRYLGSGIGRQICLAYAQAGCKAITLADIRIENAEETISIIETQGYKAQTLALKVDVTDASSVRSMVSETIKAFGSLDYG